MKSVFTDDLEHSIISGMQPVHIHHIFEGRQGYKKNAEKRGFIIPLTPWEHNLGGPTCIHQNVEMSRYWKRKAQEYYEEHYGTREQFREEFGKSYL